MLAWLIWPHLRALPWLKERTIWLATFIIISIFLPCSKACWHILPCKCDINYYYYLIRNRRELLTYIWERSKQILLLWEILLNAVRMWSMAYSLSSSSWSNATAPIYMYSVRKVPDLIWFWVKPGGFQRSALHWNPPDFCKTKGRILF